MKFIISTQELNHLINQAFNVVSQKATIPILSNFLIEAVTGEIRITATDLTVGVRCFTSVKILEEGAITVSAKHFAMLMRELTSAHVEITVNANDVVEIIADSSKFKLNGKNRNEFPSLPDINDARQFKIEQTDLKDLLYKTSFAVSKEDNQYALTGLLIRITEGVLKFVGTDGKRLAKAYASLGLDSTFNGDYILPLKAIDEVLKNLKDGEMATIYLMDDKVAIEVNNIIIISKLVPGPYPEYSRVIPKDLEYNVSLHREELMILLRQVALFTADVSHSVRFTFNGGEVLLSVNSSNIGEGKVSMPVDFHGPQFVIAFNPGFFLDILKHCKSETVNLGLIDAYNPGAITELKASEEEEGVNVGAGSLDSTPLFVMMPMRLHED